MKFPQEQFFQGSFFLLECNGETNEDFLSCEEITGEEGEGISGSNENEESNKGEEEKKGKEENKEEEEKKIEEEKKGKEENKEEGKILLICRSDEEIKDHAPEDGSVDQKEDGLGDNANKDEMIDHNKDDPEKNEEVSLCLLLVFSFNISLQGQYRDCHNA